LKGEEMGKREGSRKFYKRTRYGNIYEANALEPLRYEFWSYQICGLATFDSFLNLPKKKLRFFIMNNFQWNFKFKRDFSLENNSVTLYSFEIILLMVFISLLNTISSLITRVLERILA